MNSFVLKCFFSSSRKSSIQFIGKREMKQNSPLTKQAQAIVQTATTNNQYVSPISSAKYRPQLTQEEIEVINSGGVTNIKDWNKIKLKRKL